MGSSLLIAVRSNNCVGPGRICASLSVHMNACVYTGMYIAEIQLSGLLSTD